MFAPSMYASAPAPWTASSTAWICFSNRPSVEGLVSITAAVRGPSAARSAAALIHGYTSFDPDLRVAGVILNNVGGEIHADMIRDAVAGSFHQLLRRRRARKVGTKHHRIGEETEERGQLGQGPARDGRSDRKIGVARQPRQQRGKCRENKHQPRQPHESAFGSAAYLDGEALIAVP